MKTSTPSSEELFERFSIRGDHEALEQLAMIWHARAFAVACYVCKSRALAEEAVQDAFLKLAANKNKFRPQQAGSFRSWFFTIVTNSARMACRSERRAQKKKEIDPTAYQRRKGIETNVEQNERIQIRNELKRTLENIEERWRIPLVLHFLEGIQQKELASMLGVSQQMVSKRIEKGKQLLRAGLEKVGYSASYAMIPTLLTEAVGPIPTDLGLNVISNLSRGSALQQGASTSTRVAKSSLATTPLSIFLGVGVIACMSVALLGNPPQDQSKPVPEIQAFSPLSWDFNNGIPGEVIPTKGNPIWSATGGMKGSGALEVGPEHANLKLTTPLPSKCILRFKMSSPIPVNHSLIIKPRGDHIQDISHDMLAPMTVLQHGKTRAFECFIDFENHFIGMTIDGKPISFYRWKQAESYKDAYSPIYITTSSAILDDLSVQMASPEIEEKWSQWIKHKVLHKIFIGFEASYITYTHGTFGGRYFGDIRHAKNNGKDGGNALLCNASPTKPTSFITPSISWNGIEITEFDYFPKDQFALKRKAINLFFGKRKQDQSWEKFIRKMHSDPLPNRLAASWRNRPLGSEAPILKKWNKIVFLSGNQTSICIVNGKLFSSWEGQEFIDKSNCQALQLMGHCCVDNYRVRMTSSPKDVVLKHFLVPAAQ